MATHDLLTRYRSKKEAIRELLKEGKLSDAEIAKKVGCSARYVWNTKSEIKADSFKTKVESASEEKQVSAGLPEAQPTSVSNEQQTVEETKGSLEKKDLKIIYREFFKGLKPPEIVAKHGYPIELIETEYRQFKRYDLTDMDEFQRKIMESFVSGSSNPDLLNLKEAYKSKGYLTNDELLGLINLICREQYDAGLNSINDSRTKLPDGWMRAPCRICGAPYLFAVIVNYKEVPWEFFLEKYFKEMEELVCGRCKKRLESDHYSS